MARNKKKNDDKPAETDAAPAAEIDHSAEAAPANADIEAVSSGDAAAQQKQVQLQIDDRNTPSAYSGNARVWGTAEEIFLDFSQGLRPAGQNALRLKIDHRVVMNPWAAKRLAVTLGQTIQRYEQTYGALELDDNKRRGS